MADLSDETLMAYADGVLDPALREVVEAALRDHPEYRAKVEKFRQTLGPIRRAFEEGPLPETPASLVGKLRSVQAWPVDATSAMPRAGWRADGRMQGYRSFFAPRLPMAIAASVALLIGMGLGWVLQPNGLSPVRTERVIAFGDGGLTAQGLLWHALETSKSGLTIVTVSNGQTWRVKPSFTFRALDGPLCRRYEMANDGDGRFAGYACRASDGKWLVQAHIKSETSTFDSRGFVPSAGRNDAALDAAIDALRDSDVLESGVEDRMIENGWLSRQR